MNMEDSRRMRYLVEEGVVGEVQQRVHARGETVFGLCVEGLVIPSSIDQVSLPLPPPLSPDLPSYLFGAKSSIVFDRTEASQRPQKGKVLQDSVLDVWVIQDGLETYGEGTKG